MGAFSTMLGSYPKQLTAQQVAEVSHQAHKLSTDPNAPADAAQWHLKRSDRGVYYAPPTGNKKKDQREARKAKALVVAHLETPGYQKLYGPANAQKSLSSLTAFGEGLGPHQFSQVMEPVSTAPQSAQVAASAQKVFDGLKALRSQGLPVGGPTPPVQWPADGTSERSHDLVQAWGKALNKEGELMASAGAKSKRETSQLGTLVAPALGDFELPNGQRLGTLFTQALGKELAKNLSLDSLYEDLVVEPFKRMRKLSDKLDDLLKLDQLPGYDGKALRDDRIIQRSQELMACVADTHEQLATLAERLAQVLAPQLPGRMREELVQLSAALSALALEGLAPKSRCMQLHQRAQEQYLLAVGRRADRRVQDAAETVIKQTDGWLNAGCDPRHSGAVIDGSSAAQQDHSADLCVRLTQQARTAAAGFARLLPPAETPVPPTPEQAALQRRLDAALDRLPLTKGLRAEVPDLAELLFEVLPQDIDGRLKDLRAARLRAQNLKGKEAIAAHEDLRAQSEDLMLMVIQYVQALATVGHVLANGVPREDLPFDEQRVIQTFAQSLTDLAAAVAKPQSERMRAFKEGHETFQASLQALKQWRFVRGVAPTSPAKGSQLAPQRAPNASFYAEIDRELDDLLASDLMPSPRRPELSTKAELEQLEKLSDEQWLETVNDIASPGLQGLDKPKQAVQASMLAVPATRLYAQSKFKGHVRRDTHKHVGPANAASSAPKSLKVDEVQDLVPDSLFGADAQAQASQNPLAASAKADQRPGAWRAARPPQADAAAKRTSAANPLGVQRGEDLSSRQEIVLRRVESSWSEAQKSLSPEEGAVALSPKQQRVAQWWAEVFGSEATPASVVNTLVKAWPQNLELVRARLKALVEARTDQPDPDLEARIQATSQELLDRFGRYFDQLGAAGQRLSQAAGFPPGNGFLAHREAMQNAGKSLLALHNMFMAPDSAMSKAREFAQQAAATSAQRLSEAGGVKPGRPTPAVRVGQKSPVPKRVRFAEPSAPKQVPPSDAAVNGLPPSISAANGLHRWGGTPNPTRPLAVQALPTGALRKRRDDVQVPRVLPDPSSTRPLPSERSQVDTAPLTNDELAESLGQTPEQTRAVLSRKPQGPAYWETEDDRRAAPSPRKASALGEADRPLAEFVRLGFEPGDGQQVLSDEQTDLKQRFDAKLQEVFPTATPDVSQLHRYLSDQRASLTRQRRELVALMRAGASADELSAAARRLVRGIDRHRTQLFALGHFMANAPVGASVSPAVAEAMKAAGRALLKHEAKLSNPGSSLMANRRAAKAMQTGSEGEIAPLLDRV